LWCQITEPEARQFFEQTNYNWASGNFRIPSIHFTLRLVHQPTMLSGAWSVVKKQYIYTPFHVNEPFLFFFYLLFFMKNIENTEQQNRFEFVFVIHYCRSLG
jgi:hypothetical protein